MASQRILIDNQQKTEIQTGTIHKKTEQILNALGYNAHEISIVFMDNASMQELNKHYRGLDRPTNVLSFPMMEGEFTNISPDLLGDVVICVETARKECRKSGITLDERLSQLLVHGILHLVGFDHEKGEDQAQTMEGKSIDLLQLIEKNKDLKAF
ncbi:MAG: rRNA maturation RNase YbeY [Desulfobacteraceae bacterium]|nr:rRNA maturation RNase YbeY [Desulfobacteraceae bacterium]